MSVRVIERGSRVYAYCKDMWAYHDYPSSAHATAAFIGLREIDDEEEMYRATADWELVEDESEHDALRL